MCIRRTWTWATWPENCRYSTGSTIAAKPPHSGSWSNKVKSIWDRCVVGCSYLEVLLLAYKTVLHSYGLDSNPSSDDNDDVSSDLEMMVCGLMCNTLERFVICLFFQWGFRNVRTSWTIWWLTCTWTSRAHGRVLPPTKMSWLISAATKATRKQVREAKSQANPRKEVSYSVFV